MTTRRGQIRDALLAGLGRDLRIMGILNVTPDSFSDGGLYLDADVAVARAAAMREEGADVIDIGGESTRPDAAPVPEKDELARTGAAIRAVCRDMDCPVSIDTYKAGVARAAAKAGAVLVNDVWGMTRDPEMARAVAETESAVVITYNRGAADDSISLADDMKAFFDRAFHCAKEAGIPREFVILDPGIGFSKTWRQNFEALARLDVMLDYGRPVLVGLSRKSFIGRLLNKTVGERETGTLIANIVALQRGAAMIRVHDVAAHKDALKMLDALGGQA